MAVRYFAYGSNMSEKVMAERCPGHTSLGRALLPDHRLVFSRRSIRSGTGVMDVAPSPGSQVWGALYELDEDGLAVIDRKEGAGWAYERAPVMVLPEGEPPEVEAVTYRVISPEPVEVPPSREYVENLIRSARERGLPDDYVRQLETFRERAEAV